MAILDISLSPGWILSLFLAGACAAVFKAGLVDRARGFPLCWAISLVGFLAGQVLAENGLGVPLVVIPQVGDVFWLQGILLAFLLMFVVGRTRLW